MPRLNRIFLITLLLLIASFMIGARATQALEFLSGPSLYNEARGDRAFLLGGTVGDLSCFLVPGYQIVEAYKSVATSLEAAGYTCSVQELNRRACALYYAVRYDAGTYNITCSRTFGADFSANKIDDYTLEGFQNYITDTQKFSATSQLIIYTVPSYANMGNSPFLYLHNPPTGNISVSLKSLLDTYFPKPAFNQTNGWSLVSKDGDLSVDATPVKHLFYELLVPKITLSRNGRNFSSKEEVVSFLKHSDFLSRLGLKTKEQQQNSLDYFLPKLAAAPETPYYYLTILSKEAVKEISTLSITPKPSREDRQYFALYPTTVPVKTTGDFVFPRATSESGFTVQETGEFLVTPSMFVFFE